MRGALAAIALTAVAVVSVQVAGQPPAVADRLLLAVDAPAADGLVTNEWAYWNPTVTGAVRSPVWQANSGSLFAAGGRYWSGPVDDRTPDRLSAQGTNSAILRVTTVRADFTDVAVRLRLTIDGQTSTASTPPVDWDGAHIFLRYQNEASLYYASVARRDGAVVVKKKCPGGPSNGGTYYPLGHSARAPIAAARPVWFTAAINTSTDRTVRVRVWRVRHLLVDAVDTGIGCPPILHPGAIGIRGDNTELRFDRFRATTP